MGKLDFVVKLLWCFGYNVANQSSFFKKPNNKLKAYTTIYAVLSMCISIKNQKQKLLLLKALTGVTAKFRNNTQTTTEISTRLIQSETKKNKVKVQYLIIWMCLLCILLLLLLFFKSSLRMYTQRISNTWCTMYLYNLTNFYIVVSVPIIETYMIYRYYNSSLVQLRQKSKYYA